ncbi:MAG: hypothetical protein EOO66_14825 [Methylobacterium sp.]|nr:MAG: hypothetical protein EOO66_14825 [Methylobacterium sp.]
MSATAAMTVAGLAAYAMLRTLGGRADPAATRRDLADAAGGRPRAAPRLGGVVFLNGDTPLAEPDIPAPALDKGSAFAYSPLPPVRSNWRAARRPRDQREAMDALW